MMAPGDSDMTPTFDGFTAVDFPPLKNFAPIHADGFVYTLFWCHSGLDVPFYVGETGRLVERMNDYCVAGFRACTDFRAGEAIRYLREVKNYRIVARYKPSESRKNDEKNLIRQLLLLGVRLLNSFPSYNYRVANETDERTAIQNYCDMLIKFENSGLEKLG